MPVTDLSSALCIELQHWTEPVLQLLWTLEAEPPGRGLAAAKTATDATKMASLANIVGEMFVLEKRTSVGV